DYPPGTRLKGRGDVAARNERGQEVFDTRGRQIFQTVHRSARPDETRDPFTGYALRATIDPATGLPTATTTDPATGLSVTISPAWPPCSTSLGRVNEMGTVFCTI